MSLQDQNSPLKSLLEIIVKYHITNVRGDSINSNESDCLQSATIRLFDSPALTSAVVTDTALKALRYGVCPSFHLLIWDDSVFTGCFWRRSDPEEVCRLKPVALSSLPESKRLSAKGYWAAEAENQTHQLAAVSLMDRQTPAWESAQKSRVNQARRGFMAGPVTKTSLVNF